MAIENNESRVGHTVDGNEYTFRNDHILYL